MSLAEEPDPFARLSREQVLPFYEAASATYAARPWSLLQFHYRLSVPSIDVVGSSVFAMRSILGPTQLIMSPTFSENAAMREGLLRPPQDGVGLDLSTTVAVEFYAADVAPRAVVERIRRENLPLRYPSVIPFAMATAGTKAPQFLTERHLTVLCAMMWSAEALANLASRVVAWQIGTRRFSLPCGEAEVHYPHPEWKGDVHDTMPDWEPVW